MNDAFLAAKTQLYKSKCLSVCVCVKVPQGYPRNVLD